MGLYVQAAIQGRQLPAAHTIARDALRAGNIAFVVDAQNQLQIRRVEVIHTDADIAVVSSGLQAGELVVTSPVRNPVPGMALMAIQNDTPTQQ